MSRNKPKEEAPEDKGPDEDLLRHQQMVASTFANAELHQTKKTLKQYIKLFNEATLKVEEKQKEIDDHDRDNSMVVTVLRQELDNQKNFHLAQKKIWAEEKNQQKNEFAEERAQWEQTAKDCQKEIDDLKRTIQEQQADLEALNAFKRERHEMHMELQRFKDDHLRVIEQYEQEISKQRFLALEEKVRLQGEERQMKETIEKEVRERAQKLLVPKTKEIHEENTALLRDKAERERELAKLNQENAALTEKLAANKRECDLARSADTEHVKRAVGKAREIKDLRMKVETLEGRLAAMQREHSGALTTVQQGGDRTMRQLVLERDNALKTAESLQRDLIKVRALAKTVVAQRTDLELFFNQALEYVKNQIAAQRSLQPITGSQRLNGPPGPGRGGNVKQMTTPSGALPAITAGRGAVGSSSQADSQKHHSQKAAAASAKMKRGSDVSHPFFKDGAPQFESVGADRPASQTAMAPPHSRENFQTSQGDPTTVQSDGPSAYATTGNQANFARVDVADLSWVDKERVLRILFAKINATNQARGSRKERVVGESGILQVTQGPALPAIGSRPSTEDGSNADDDPSMFLTQDAGMRQPL